MVKKLDLHRCKAENCIKCKNSEERRAHQDTDGYCRSVNPSDHVGVRCVGDWGADKVVFISTYMDITGKAMKYKFTNYYYIEICSGPGRCVDYRKGEEFDGTALAALTTEGAAYYNKLFFFDLNPKTVENLRLRIDESTDIPQEVKDRTVVSVGDYSDPNSIIGVLKTHIPNNMRGLNVVFLDPTDMSVPFDLYLAMMDFGNRTDFIINFADGTDLRRNITLAFEKPESAVHMKYMKVLEVPDFFNDPVNIEYGRNGNYLKLTEKFENTFIQSFKNRGFEHIHEKRIKRYYKLLFFSSNEKGVKFWKQASNRNAAERENGQLVLFQEN